MGDQDKLAGKAKEAAGKVTGDDELEAEGKVQHAKGKVDEKIDELKDTAKGAYKAAKDAATKNDKQ